MKDSKNNDLKVGQTVVFSGDESSCLYTGSIIGFTKFYVILLDEYGNKCKKYPAYTLIIK